MRKHKESGTHAHHSHKKDARMQKVIIGLAVVFLAFAVYDLYLAYSSNAIVGGKIAAAAEAAKPANIEVTKILAPSCRDCFDISFVDNALAQLNVKASEKTLDYAGAEAKQLISKYGIRKIPAILITGETEKAGISFWSQIGTKETDGTLVMRFGAPYIDPSNGMEIGKAELVNLVDKTCGSCYNVSIQESILKDGFGFVFGGIKTYDAGSADGASLVSLYNITKVPTIIISGDAKYYEMNNFQTVWKQVGTIEKDGRYVFRSMEGLTQALGVVSYRDLSLNKIINATAR